MRMIAKTMVVKTYGKKRLNRQHQNQTVQKYPTCTPYTGKQKLLLTPTQGTSSNFISNPTRNVSYIDTASYSHTDGTVTPTALPTH